MADKPTLEQVMKLEDQLEMIIEADSAVRLPAETSERLRKLKLALANNSFGGPRRAVRIDATNEFFDNSLAQNMTIAQGFIEQFPVTPLELETFRDTGEVQDYQQKRAYRKKELKHFDIEVLEDAWERIYKSDPRKRFNPPRKDRLIETKDPHAMAEYRKALTQALERTPRVGDEIYRFEGNRKMKQYLSAIDTVYVPIDQSFLKDFLRKYDRLPRDIAYDTIRIMMDMAMGSKSDVVWGIPKNLAWELASKLEDDETNRLLRRAIARGATNLTETSIDNSIFNRQYTEDLKGVLRQIKSSPEATKMARTNSGRGEVVDLNTDKYYATDPGTADLYAARTQEAMEARAKSRNPVAIERINKLIQDVVDMGYSDLDTAVIVNQSVLDYLENVEGSIDEDVRRFMSYSNMMPPEMVDRLNQLGPQRTRQLVEGARRLGLRIPTSLGALGLIALLPLLDDDEAVVGGTGLAAAGVIGPPTDLESMKKESNRIFKKRDNLLADLESIKQRLNRSNNMRMSEREVNRQTARVREIEHNVEKLNKLGQRLEIKIANEMADLEVIEDIKPLERSGRRHTLVSDSVMPTAQEIEDFENPPRDVGVGRKPGQGRKPKPIDDPPPIPGAGGPPMDDPPDTPRQTAASNVVELFPQEPLAPLPDNLIDASGRFSPVLGPVLEGLEADITMTPTAYQRAAIEAAIAEMVRRGGEGQVYHGVGWLAGGPDDMPLWMRNEQARRIAAEAARKEFRLLQGKGKKPKIPKPKGFGKLLGPLGAAIDTVFIGSELIDIYGDRGAVNALSDKEKNARLKELILAELTFGLKPGVELGEALRAEELSGEFVNAAPWLRSLYKKYGDGTTAQEALEAELTDEELTKVRQRIDDDEAAQRPEYTPQTDKLLGLEDDKLSQAAVARAKAMSPAFRPETNVEFGELEELSEEVWDEDETKEALEKMGISWEEVMN